MKKTILITILALLGLSQSMAQIMGPDDWWEWDYSDYMPIVQEGVKWVNEKVIINHGDTTSYYYTYEIQGDDTEWHQYSYGNAKLCHYYTGETIDYSNDSIISSLEESTNVGKDITCFDNWAFDKVVREGRNIMPHRFWIGETDRLGILHPLLRGFSITARTQHGDRIGDNFSKILFHTIFLPTTGTEPPLHIQKFALGEILFRNIGQRTPARNVVPLRVLLAVALLVFIAFRSGQRETDFLHTAFKNANFGILAHISNENNFVNSRHNN